MRRKIAPAIATIEIEIPDWNRLAFTKMLLAGKTIVPWTRKERLIDDPFFYSHEHDVERAMDEIFTPQWISRKFSQARAEAAELANEFAAEGIPEQQLKKLNANALFKGEVKRALRRVRLDANQEICRCWVRILKSCPEYVDLCPWRFFQGDRIWQSLQDKELLRAINHTQRELAEKFNLNAMSPGDWSEVLKIVPELESRRPKKEYDCLVE